MSYDFSGTDWTDVPTWSEFRNLGHQIKRAGSWIYSKMPRRSRRPTLRSRTRAPYRRRSGAIKRKFTFSTSRPTKRSRRTANTVYRKRSARGRRIPTGTGFNAPAPKTHWNKRRTSRPDHRVKQLTSIISVAARKDLEYGLNVVPDTPQTSQAIASATGPIKDRSSMNASIGQREADASSGAPNFDQWEWTHLNGATTTIPYFPNAAATPPIPLSESAEGGMVGMFMYRFNPLDMENWDKIQKEYEWIRILGMELIIKPHWRSRYSKTGPARAPDVQTRMSNMIDYNGTINFGTTNEKKGFFTDMHTAFQPLSAELFVKKFKSYEETAAGSAYTGTAKFIEHGLHPIGIESGRKVSIKVKPTAFVATVMGSTADFNNTTETTAFTAVPTQWLTTDQLQAVFDPTNFDDHTVNPALATIGLCMKNVPVYPVLTNLNGLKMTGDMPSAPSGVLGDGGFTKQFGYATCNVIYHYQVKGTKRPMEIADPTSD